MTPRSVTDIWPYCSHKISIHNDRIHISHVNSQRTRESFFLCMPCTANTSHSLSTYQFPWAVTEQTYIKNNSIMIKGDMKKWLPPFSSQIASGDQTFVSLTHNLWLHSWLTLKFFICHVRQRKASSGQRDKDLLPHQNTLPYPSHRATRERVSPTHTKRRLTLDLHPMFHP